MQPKSIARAVVIAAAVAVATAAIAQPERQPPAPATADQPEAVRERLRMRLERARESIGRLESLLARLDAGESIDPTELSDLAPERPVRGRFGEGAGDGLERRGPGPREDAPGPGGFGWADAPANFDPEEVAGFIRAELPWLDERLNRADSDHPGMREEMLRRVTPQIVEIMQTRRDDPELARLRLAQFRLGADWIEASRRIRDALRGGEVTRDQAVSAFTELAERHFDLRQRITRHEIERLRTELAARERELNQDDARRVEWIGDMARRMVERVSGRQRGPRDSDEPDRERGPGGEPRGGRP